MVPRQLFLVPSAMYVAGVAAQSMVGIADFTQAGINGTVLFVQRSSTSPVRVIYDLGDGVRDKTSVTINAFPVVSDCSLGSVGWVYNPTSLEDREACKATNRSSCMAGDLVRKFGQIGARNAKDTVEDDTLTLDGVFSIYHRSLVLSQGDQAYACATILPSYSTNMLVAHFNGSTSGLRGSIFMLQHADNSTHPTTVLIDLALQDRHMLEGALYHVHNGSMLGPNDMCEGLGYHFNPTNGGPCTPDPEVWSTCELGDLSGRHGPLDLPATANKKLFFTDTSLRLSGLYDMTNRSIVVHNTTGKRIACAPLVATDAAPFFLAAAGERHQQRNGTTTALRRG